MKHTTSTSSRPVKPYPSKRPSPHGITKRSKTGSPASCTSRSMASRATPASSSRQHVQQRKRREQVLTLHREGVYLEEEYREEIEAHMREMERCTVGSTSSMDQQPQIKWHMRPCLVDFLVEVHFTFRLRPETLYLALNILDRYVSRRVVFVKHYQLVGCAALWIAAKFEDAKERVPTAQDLVNICNEAYEETAFIQMEFHVLQTIEWALGHPTAEAWLRLLCSRQEVEDTKVQHIARFLMEITLFYREFVKYLPSTIALGALTLARYLCDKPRRVFEETEECLEVIDHLDTRLRKHVNELSEVLVKKYSYAFYSKAATSVVQYYLAGGRYEPGPLPISLPTTATASPPSTPPRRKSAGTVHTPPSAMSTTSTASDVSDDMPATPTSPYMSDYSSEPFSDKENQPTAFEPVVAKQYIDNQVPDGYLPADLTFGRTALHAINIASPRVAAVS